MEEKNTERYLTVTAEAKFFFTNLVPLIDALVVIMHQNEAQTESSTLEDLLLPQKSVCDVRVFQCLSTSGALQSLQGSC